MGSIPKGFKQAWMDFIGSGSCWILFFLDLCKETEEKRLSTIVKSSK